MNAEEAMQALAAGTHVLAPGPEDDPYPKLWPRFVLVRNTPSKPCPKCGMELRGDPIPEASRHKYGATHFGREIAIYDMDRDRTVAYRCPDCGHGWKR